MELFKFIPILHLISSLRMEEYGNKTISLYYNKFLEAKYGQILCYYPNLLAYYISFQKNYRSCNL